MHFLRPLYRSLQAEDADDAIDATSGIWSAGRAEEGPDDGAQTPCPQARGTERRGEGRSLSGERNGRRNQDCPGNLSGVGALNQEEYGEMENVSDIDTDFKNTLRQLGLGDGWEQENGSWWITPEGNDIRAITNLMIARGARFVTITAVENTSEEFNLDYHWDLNGQLLTFLMGTKGRRIESIYDLVPAADWAEREIHDYFAIAFSGRDSMQPLMLRVGDMPGVHLGGGAVQ